MCGIFGFNWEDKRLLMEMAKSIPHRGPDQDGYFTDKGISLGHKRLSIIDLSEKGRQPMYNEDGDICVIFNGEIYNFQEIRPELEKKGHRFLSDSDTEVIIHAYEEYGTDCLKLFNGMFAFAIWDSKKKQLFIARDRLGIKPLYYYFKNGNFIFASEIKSILQHEIERELDIDCLKQIIAYEYTIAGDTLIKGVSQLKPGNYLVLKGKSLAIKPYWELDEKETNESSEFYASKLQSLLQDSVKHMLISDVPLGMTLSGGIDSSVIVALAAKMTNKPVKTFTAGFDVPEDEFSAAKIVSEYCHTEHKEIHMSSKDYVSNLLKTIWHMEFPFSRPAMVSVYNLYKEIGKDVTVSLCGEGSDELFAGYRRYDAYSALPKKEEVSKEEYDELASKIGFSFKDKVNYISSSAFVKDKGEFFSEEITNLAKKHDVNTTFGKLIKDCKNGDGSQLNKALLYELKTEIPYFHCNKLDKTSMAHSHEVRVPYLDHRIVEFAMSIPSKYKFYGSEKKIILQKVAKNFLPNEIVKRKKLPMVTPISDYFKKELISISEELLSDDALKKIDYYKISRIKKLVEDVKHNRVSKEQTKSSRGNPFRQLLLLTNIELWKKMFIEGDIRKPNLDINNYI